MPLFFQQNINETTKLAVWRIEESEAFFLENVPLQADITHPHKRLQHLAGRYLLSYLFSDFPKEEIEIADTRKPFLPNEQYHFSISHCQLYAAAIVSSQYRVGIDVECITARVGSIKTKFLHPEELDFVNLQPSKNELALLTVLWSAKEAMFKWFGRGKVDFRSMMGTFPFDLKEDGIINGWFHKDDFEKKLQLHYKLFNEVSLVFTFSTFN